MKKSACCWGRETWTDMVLGAGGENRAVGAFHGRAERDSASE